MICQKKNIFLTFNRILHLLLKAEKKKNNNGDYSLTLFVKSCPETGFLIEIYAVHEKVLKRLL